MRNKKWEPSGYFLERAKQLGLQADGAYRKGHLLVLETKCEQHGDYPFHHISVSHPSRYPTWDELLEVRYTFFPDTAEVAQILPRKEQYINLHKHCFHLWSPHSGKLVPAGGEK